MVLLGIAWYYMVLHGIARYCMVLHGIALYCIVLQDIAWYCMVLYSILLRPLYQIRARIMRAFRSPAFKFCHIWWSIWWGFNGLKPHDANARHSKIYAGKPVFAPGWVACGKSQEHCSKIMLKIWNRKLQSHLIFLVGRFLLCKGRDDKTWPMTGVCDDQAFLAPTGRFLSKHREGDQLAWEHLTLDRPRSLLCFP